MPDRPVQQTVPRYRAPEENGAVLALPDWTQWPAVLGANQLRLRETDHYDCQGRRLGVLRRLAREQLLGQARLWTQSYQSAAGVPDRFSPKPGNPPQAASATEAPFPAQQPPRPASQADAASRPTFPPEEVKMILTGHQPQLFHPGVWIKNFGLDRLARKLQAVAVHLIIDHDIPQSVQIRTPTGVPQEPRWVEIPLDAPAPGIAYEDRPILNWHLLEAFGQRACEAISNLVPAPMLREFWPAVLERARATGRLGAALAQARHLWEIRWGSQTLEVPFSWLCQGDAFWWFATHLIAQLPQLYKHYNIILEEYRRRHRIRSAAQPVPNLHTEEDWLEAPLWMWTASEPIRRTVFVRQTGQEAILSNQAGLEVRLPIRPEGDLAPAVAILQELAEQGLRLRPKALLTTLWARLVLGDLFIHGIGGARYDQITDELIRRWMGLEPPEFLVLSGTLYLPVDGQPASREEWLYVQKQLRDLTWHPEWFLNSSKKAGPPTQPLPEGKDPEALVAEKWRWIRTPVTPENAWLRFLAIRRINQALQAWLSELRAKFQAQQAALEARLQAEKILRWRDWPFCFYPEQTLQEFFANALQAVK